MISPSDDSYEQLYEVFPYKEGDAMSRRARVVRPIMSEEVVQKSSALEEVGLDSPREGEDEQGKAEEGAGEAPSNADPELEGAAAATTGPQPPYDEDFNPFTEDDIKKILHEEKCSDEKEGWKFVSRSEFTEVWRKSDSAKPVHLIKAFLRFPGIPPDIVSDLIHNSEQRLKWDKLFLTIDVIEEHKNFRVMYWVAKLPPTVANRDLVQFIRREHNEADNTTYFLYRNATHPEVPPRRGLVRAETILSGIVLRPDPEDPNSTKMSLMLQNDIKGWIPHFVVNAFAARSPKQWHDSLVNFYENVYSKDLKSANGATSEEGEEGKTEQESEVGEGGAHKDQSSDQ